MKRIRKARTKPDARHQSARSSSKKLKSPQGDEAPESKPIASGADWLEQFMASSKEKLLAWQNRPTLDSSYFDDTERAAELVSHFGSIERLESVKKLMAAFHKKPSLENYVQFRRSVPGMELEIAASAGIEALPKLEKDLTKHGIDESLFYGILDSFEPDIDELSLRLMELLVARDKLPKGGPGHIEKRQDAISDTLVNYLIADMLEAMELHKRAVLIPASLVVLIRDRLCGPDPDLRREIRASEKNKELKMNIFLASHAALSRGEEISIRKLAKTFGVNKNIVARLFADPDYKSSINQARQHYGVKRNKSN
jgi:hypothetical protein